jgi:chemotaxis protein methyltransferase CheR
MRFEEFLREVAPRLGIQWKPFRKDGIKRRLERRIAELGLSAFEQYLEEINRHPEEEDRLSEILTVTISRFFRDGEVFRILETTLIPNLLKGNHETELTLWSVGCASGEEPYSLSLLWKKAFAKDYPDTRLSIIATDINRSVLERAEKGTYKESSLQEVPEEIRRRFFKPEGRLYLLDEEIRKSVDFRRHRILRDEPFSGVNVVFCRNCAFTYFSKESQIEALRRIFNTLKDDGYLIIGNEESLPLTYPTLFVPVFSSQKIFQKFRLNRRRSQNSY